VDAALFSAINGAHAPWIDSLMTWVSLLWYFPGVLFLSAAAGMLSPRLRAPPSRLPRLALTYAMASGVVKPLGRARLRGGPVAARTVEPAGHGLSSGHAATAVAGALSGARLVPAAAPVLWGLATLMAVLRVYVGVWPLLPPASCWAWCARIWCSAAVTPLRGLAGARGHNPRVCRP
jgi:hypothetical protein